MRHPICAALLALVSAQAAAQARPVIAIFDLTNRGASPLEVEATASAAARGLRELDAFDVFSTDDLRQMLAIERQKQLFGSGEDGSLAASLSAVGAQHQIVGSVTRSEGGLSAELRLIDVGGGTVLAQKEVGPFPALDALVRAMPGAVQEVVAPLLREQVGSLVVRSVEQGAEVVVDDVSRGTTPTVGAISLPMGRHRLLVKKEGFVTHTSTAVVKRGEVEVKDVVLVPSADYAKAWASRNQKMRLGAWITTGLALAAVGSALIVDRGVAEPLYQNEFAPRQQVLQAYARGSQGFSPSSFTGTVESACADDLEACRTQLQKLQGDLQGLSAGTWVLLGAGVLSAGISAYFWIAGDDPNKYVQLVGGAGPGGATLGVRGAF